jgi:hypothetical protein
MSFAGVQVPGTGREKLEELGGGVFARVGQDRRHGVSVAKGQCVILGSKFRRAEGFQRGSFPSPYSCIIKDVGLNRFAVCRRLALASSFESN